MPQTTAPFPGNSVTLCPLVVMLLTMSCKILFKTCEKSNFIIVYQSMDLPMGNPFRIEISSGTAGDASSDYRWLPWSFHRTRDYGWLTATSNSIHLNSVENILLNYLVNYVGSCSGDFSATSSSNNRTDATSYRIDDDGGCHGRHRSFARFNEICWTGRYSKIIDNVGRWEIVHFVVHQNSGLLRDPSSAKSGQ